MKFEEKLKHFEKFSISHPIEWVELDHAKGNIKYIYCGALNTCDNCVHHVYKCSEFAELSEHEYKKLKTIYPEYVL